jgi:hypothetical protein
MARSIFREPAVDCIRRPSKSFICFMTGVLPPLVVFALAPSAASAACAMGAMTQDCVSRSFSATVSFVVDPTGIYGVVGSTVSGSISYDSSIADVDPLSNVGEYPNAIECAFITAGDFSFELVLGQDDDSDSTVEVQNDATNNEAGFVDAVGGAIAASGFNDNMIVGVGALGYGYSDFCIEILGNCPVTLVTNDLFPPAPGAAIPSSDLFRVEFVDLLGGTGTILGDIVSLSDTAPIACPEPGPVPSLAAALLCLGAVRRWHGDRDHG